MRFLIFLSGSVYQPLEVYIIFLPFRVYFSWGNSDVVRLYDGWYHAWEMHHPLDWHSFEINVAPLRFAIH